MKNNKAAIFNAILGTYERDYISASIEETIRILI